MPQDFTRTRRFFGPTTSATGLLHRLTTTAFCAGLAAFTLGCPAKDAADNTVQDKAVGAVERDAVVAGDSVVPDGPGRTHVVVADDTLFNLAQRYYGNGKYYRRILVANRNRIKDPDKLPVGMKLIIP